LCTELAEVFVAIIICISNTKLPFQNTFLISILENKPWQASLSIT
jgi:hypothetical protein